MTKVPTPPEFNEAFAHVMTFEGGYANNKNDSGGETFRGIARNFWPNWPGWEALDAAKASLGKKATAKAIDSYFKGNEAMDELVGSFYFENFWKPWKKHDLPDRLTAKLFDTGINLGVGGATKVLQNALNSFSAPVPRLKADGVWGPLTSSRLAHVLGDYTQQEILQVYAAYQTNYYEAIIKRKPSQAQFRNGWLRRAKWLPK